MRMNYRKVHPEAFETMLKLEHYMHTSGIEKTMYELIKIRASQINGCAFCLDMHTKELLGMGEAPERVYLLSVWKEAPCYSEKEKAALELTESLTLVASGGLPQQVYDRVREHWSEQEFVVLIMAINTINSWNRIAISTGMYPGCFS